MSQSEIRVLIIEDNIADQNLLIHLLNHMDVSCNVINNIEFINQLETINVPHAIFLDLQMPTLDGYDILHEIQQTAKFDSIPVIAYTSHWNEMPAARHAGFHSFLGKPLSATKLHNQLVQILNGEPVWDIRK